jgi:predicted nuclease of predicted toxin-antitoxin system
MSGSPRFFFDVHIAIEVVRQLRDKGVDIIHCGDVGLADADDEALLVYAIENERVMVSCDHDFQRLHHRWRKAQREHSGIVYFRMTDQCKSISVVVRELLFLHDAADYQTDLYNQLWRVHS